MLDICLRKRLYNSIKQIEKHKAGYDLNYEDVILTHMYLNKGYRSFVMCLRYINGLPFKFNNSLEELLYTVDKELCGVIYRKYWIPLDNNKDRIVEELKLVILCIFIISW